MAQIAERAGVALSTVSYVISGKRPVSDEMRARVLTAVEELDYRPHPRARALASGMSHTIALFLPSPNWDLVPVQQTFVAGATQATSASDYSLLLSTAATDPEAIVRLVSTHRADGVILMETLADDPRVRKLQSAGLPFSLIGRTADTDGISYVDLDFGAAVRTSLDHLVGLGHKCVALFNFPQDQLDAGYTSALIARDALTEATEELGIRGIHLSCPHPPHEAFAVAEALLASEPECTAAITTGWQFSGLLAALRAADMRVPDDFSIVSVIAGQYAEMLTPALTGIEWPAFEAGNLVAEMLIERLANVNAAPRQVLIGGELEVRESTGPARKVASRARATRRPRRTAAAGAGSAGNGTARG
jgi:DNA-binding LacI/PurR family transcriptional regulator